MTTSMSEKMWHARIIHYPTVKKARRMPLRVLDLAKFYFLAAYCTLL